MQTPEEPDTSRFSIKIFVEHTVVWICMWSGCVNVWLCLYLDTVFFPASYLDNGYFFLLLLFSCRAKMKEGVFHVLCNLLLWAKKKKKLPQSRLIYYQTSCLFLSCVPRKWTPDIPGTVVDTTRQCHIFKCGHHFHFGAVLFCHLVKCLSDLHLLLCIY